MSASNVLAFDSMWQSPRINKLIERDGKTGRFESPDQMEAFPDSPPKGKPGIEAGRDLPLTMRIGTVARWLDVPPATVRKWIRSGLLPSFTIGRCRFVHREDLLAFVAKHRNGIAS